MPDPLLPAQCIEEAIWNNLPLLEDTMTKQERLQLLSSAVLQFLDAEGYTLMDVDAAWTFHDELQRWLNQDDDGHRAGDLFSPRGLVGRLAATTTSARRRLNGFSALDRVSYRPGLDQAARDYIMAAILQRVHLQ